MLDEPAPTELLASVAVFLRGIVAEETEPRTAFQARVAANALDLIARQITLQSFAETLEHARLAELLHRDARLDELNDALANALANGSMTLESPGVAAHLWSTTLAKLAVDQPNYASYRAELTAREMRPVKDT